LSSNLPSLAETLVRGKMCARARERESIEWYQCVRCKESMHAYWAVLF